MYTSAQFFLEYLSIEVDIESWSYHDIDRLVAQYQEQMLLNGSLIQTNLLGHDQKSPTISTTTSSLQ